MGTRGLYCVVANTQFKVAQYGQWDAYPAGQGLAILTFTRKLNDKAFFDQFLNNVLKLVSLSGADIDQKWDDAAANGSDSFGISDSFSQKWPHLHRNCGSAVMELIASNQVNDVFLEPGFAADSLFCEWAYVIDLDRRILEVYKGFNKSPTIGQRFSNFEPIANHSGIVEYHTIALKAEFPFDTLPTDDEFTNKLNPPEPKEE